MGFATAQPILRAEMFSGAGAFSARPDLLDRVEASRLVTVGGRPYGARQGEPERVTIPANSSSISGTDLSDGPVIG